MDAILEMDLRIGPSEPILKKVTKDKIVQYLTLQGFLFERTKTWQGTSDPWQLDFYEHDEVIDPRNNKNFVFVLRSQKGKPDSVSPNYLMKEMGRFFEARDGTPYTPLQILTEILE